jgi:NitT/TauT family transport system permease protein
MKAKKIYLGTIKIFAVAAFWFAVWCLVSFRINNTFLFPSPASVFKALGELARTKEFWTTTGLSLFRVVAGIVISLLAGTILALITENSRILNALLSPLLAVIKSTPVA